MGNLITRDWTYNIQIQVTRPRIQNQFQISLHDLTTMVSVALSAPRMGSALLWRNSFCLIVSEVN
jgi:hypothetical protein